MEKTYALVNKDGVIENVIYWDGVAYSETEVEVLDKAAGKMVITKICNGYKPPEDLTPVQIDDAHIGGTYIKGVYAPPPDPHK